MSTEVKEDGPEKTTVETVDYRTQAGQEEPTKEKIEVVHLNRDPKKHDSDQSGGGVVAGATAAVTETMKSAKEAIVGKSEDSNTPK